MVLFFPQAGISADIGLAVYLATTTAEQIRRSLTSQDHIFHSTETQCHSLTHLHSLTHSLNHVFHSCSLTHTGSYLIHSHKRRSLNLEELKDESLFPFQKGGKKKKTIFYQRKSEPRRGKQGEKVTKGQGKSGRSQNKTELIHRKW